MRGEERLETRGKRERRVGQVLKGDLLEEVGVVLNYHFGEKEGKTLTTIGAQSGTCWEKSRRKLFLEKVLLRRRGIGKSRRFNYNCLLSGI